MKLLISLYGELIATGALLLAATPFIKKHQEIGFFLHLVEVKK
jgi:hypothetical protein